MVSKFDADQTEYKMHLPAEQFPEVTEFILRTEQR